MCNIFGFRLSHVLGAAWEGQSVWDLANGVATLSKGGARLSPPPTVAKKSNHPDDPKNKTQTKITKEIALQLEIYDAIKEKLGKTR